MKRALLIAGGLGVVVLGAVFLYPRPVDHPPEAPAAPAGDGASQEARPPSRRLVPDRLPKDPPPSTEAPAEAPAGRLGGESSVTADPEATALKGLEVTPMDDALREKLRVPGDSQIGYGVIVGDIHPDSPAAEVFMRRNDVIVRANLKKVDSVEDLEKLVGDRDHTLITISRDGSLMQMVLKKPYRGK